MNEALYAPHPKKKTGYSFVVITAFVENWNRHIILLHLREIGSLKNTALNPGRFSETHPRFFGSTTQMNLKNS
jgi:hypothetical protein